MLKLHNLLNYFVEVNSLLLNYNFNLSGIDIIKDFCVDPQENSIDYYLTYNNVGFCGNFKRQKDGSVVYNIDCFLDCHKQLNKYKYFLGNGTIKFKTQIGIITYKVTKYNEHIMTIKFNK